jgi:hypothetical protein
MNAPVAAPGAENPFSPRAVIGLVVFGALVFLALLYMIGAGMTGGSTNDGGAHVGGKGLNGYAALAGYLEKRGFTVRRSQDEGVLDDAGLLVLTPTQYADGAKLEKILEARRTTGPTLIILPKWLAAPVPPVAPGVKKGWVQLAGTQSPSWKGFLDDVGVKIAPLPASGAQWLGGNLTGKLPEPKTVQSGSGTRVFPLVQARGDGRVLAAYLDDGDSYAELRDLMPVWLAAASESAEVYPVVLVFEPDLFDNYGMANVANAQLADKLIRAIGDDAGGAINFDLTINGYVRSKNLLTLAFTPPFLAATLCLIIAALAAGWRAFLRFGPPIRATRAIAFGKRALVANTAGLIRRTRRRHLVAEPYAVAARERIARMLALPRLADAAATDAAIDRALAGRHPEATPFSIAAARLAAARRPHEVLKAAQDLHALERKLHR